MSDKVEIKTCPWCKEIPGMRYRNGQQVKCDSIDCPASKMPWVSALSWNQRHPDTELVRALEGCTPCMVCEGACSMAGNAKCKIKRNYDKCLELVASS